MGARRRNRTAILSSAAWPATEELAQARVCQKSDWRDPAAARRRRPSVIPLRSRDFDPTRPRTHSTTLRSPRRYGQSTSGPMTSQAPARRRTSRVSTSGRRPGRGGLPSGCMQIARQSRHSPFGLLLENQGKGAHRVSPVDVSRSLWLSRLCQRSQACGSLVQFIRCDPVRANATPLEPGAF